MARLPSLQLKDTTVSGAAHIAEGMGMVSGVIVALAPPAGIICLVATGVASLSAGVLIGLGLGEYTQLGTNTSVGLPGGVSPVMIDAAPPANPSTFPDGGTEGVGGVPESAPSEPPTPAPEEGDGGDGCFPGDTLVLMADDTFRRIDRVEVGDRVLASHEATGQVAACRIRRVFVHEVTETLRLQFEDEDWLTTTKLHRFFVPARGFVPARLLERGARIASHREHTGIEVKQSEAQVGRTVVYNLDVEDLHTYFVGPGGLLVHNRKDEEEK
jgi:hypothetical protein